MQLFSVEFIRGVDANRTLKDALTAAIQLMGQLAAVPTT